MVVWTSRAQVLEDDRVAVSVWLEELEPRVLVRPFVSYILHDRGHTPQRVSCHTSYGNVGQRSCTSFVFCAIFVFIRFSIAIFNAENSFLALHNTSNLYHIQRIAGCECDLEDRV